MKTNTKRLLVAGLGAASMGLWVPQITDMLKADPAPSDAILPALPGDAPAVGTDPIAEGALPPAGTLPEGSGPAPRAAGHLSASTLPSFGGAPPRGTGADAPSGDPSTASSSTETSRAGAPAMSELVTSLHASVERLKLATGPREHTSLEELATAWGRKHAAPLPASDARDGTRSEPVAPTTATVLRSLADERGVKLDGAVNEFLDAADVRMILIASDKRMARLGVNLVQAGDELLGGRIVVRRIERTFVVLAGDGREVRVDLRAYEPRATTRSDEGSASNASSASSATPASVPAITPAEVPAAPPTGAPTTVPTRP